MQQAPRKRYLREISVYCRLYTLNSTGPNNMCRIYTYFETITVSLCVMSSILTQVTDESTVKTSRISTVSGTQLPRGTEGENDSNSSSDDEERCASRYFVLRKYPAYLKVGTGQGGHHLIFTTSKTVSWDAIYNISSLRSD